MPYKKRVKNFFKKTTLSFVILSTIFWSVGLPVLAGAPQATQVIVTPNSAEIVFDQDVKKAGTSNPPDIANFSLQSPVGTNQILSGMNPYNHSTSYASPSGNGISWIFGLNSLNLTAGTNFRMGFSNIVNGSNETVTPSYYDGTVTAGPGLDNITPIYGKVGDKVNLSGNLFGSADPTVLFEGNNASITSSTTQAIDGVTVPSGLGDPGAKNVIVRNNDNQTFSNSRYFYLYNSSTGILTGTIFETSGATTSPIDGVEIQAYKDTEPWNRSEGYYSQKDGKFAIVVPPGTYNVAFVTPGSGSTKAAPLKSTGKVVTANTVTNLGTIEFVTKVIYGKVYAPDGTTPIYGANLNIHNQSWTIEQQAKSGSDGSYKVYVTPNSTAPQYIIDVFPPNYNPNNYLTTSETINVSGAGPYEKNINLVTENVFGIVKTPTGTATDSNPFPDAAVPGAHVHFFKSDFSFDRWSDTVRSGDNIGRFSFGGVPVGTYILEIEAPNCNDSDSGVAKFCTYARTRFESITIVSGTNDLTIKRFGLPNFFGYVFADANSNSQYDAGEGLVNARVNLNKEGFWTGSPTDSNGRYALALPNTGTYRLEVQPPTGYASYSADVSVSTLPLTSPYNIQLSVPNVTGFVYGPTGSVGQSNTWVELCPIDTAGSCYGGGTDQNGAFSLNAPNGTWQLQVHPNWDSVYSAPSPKTVVISGGALVSVDSDTSADADEPVLSNNTVIIRLIDPASDPNSFSGIVYDPTGAAPQQNIGIGLRSAVQEGTSCRGDGMSRWTQTNNQGKYAFSSVTDGLYEIEAMPWGTSSYSRVRVCHTVDSTHRALNINLTSPNITGTIATPTGSITSENPTPDAAVANTWVSLFVEGPMGPGGNWYGGNANDQGVFGLGGITPGTYTLEVQPQWGSVYSSKRYTNITLSDANADGIADATNLDTLIGTTSTNFPNKAIRVGVPNLKGQVVDNNSQPVQGVWVMVHNDNWSQSSGGNTDNQGYFRIGGLSDGTGYQTEINLPWGGSQALVAPSGLTVDIANSVGVIKQAGTLLPNNKITLSPPTKTITGWVKKGGTTAVANARVEAHRDMGGGFFETKTGTDGTYTLEVSGGSWWVETRPDCGGGVEPDWGYTEPPTRITFAEDNTTETQGVNFTVTVADATITGLVKTPTNTAVQYAWVDIRGNKGIGNGTSTDNNGRFSVKVPAGTYTVNVFSNLADYGSSDPKSATVASGQITDAGTLYLKTKDSHIRGFVQDDAGNPVQNVIVNAWLFDGAGWSMTYTDQTGAYDLSLWSGSWGVMVMPMSQNYIYMGAPKKITITSNETSAGNNFQLKLANKTLKVKVKKSDGTNVTDIWGGVWVRDTSLGSMLDFGGPMEDIMGKAGMTTTAGPGMEKGGFAGGGLMNGYTEIKVPAGTFEVGLGMPPGSKYTLSATQTVTIAATDTSKDIDLIVKANDATISGHFYLDADNDGVYDSGEEVTGIRAFIHADRDGGGWQFTESNAAAGSYSLSVAGGSWYVDAFIDSSMTFGTNQYLVINEDVKTIVADAGSATRNFKVKKLDATITGTVYNPGVGTTSPMTDGLVWVFADFGSAEMVEEFKGPGGPGLGTFTNADGTYSLKVPAGTYKIGAGLPPWDTRDLLNPDLITVPVASGATSTGNDLQFKESNATISGNITLAGVKKAGFVRAWSEDGRGAGTVSLDGTYSLKATQGDTWHIVAAAEISNAYYESAETTVTTVSGTTTYSQNLALVSKNITVPEGVSATFDATQSKTIKLTKMVGGVPQDEVVLEIPAGSIATSGTITVSITPTVNVKPDSKDKPIGLAYNFEARDSSGNKIEEFVQNVTIYMSYDPTLIAASGYSVDSITPKYYDSQTGSWENYSNVVRDAVNNRFIIKTDHFSAGGTTGGGGIPSAPSNLSATALSSSSISLSWTDNSDNETGFKIYRAETLITTTAANATSYTDANLSASTNYSYYVKATNSSGDSSASNTASATTSSAGGGGAVILPTAPTEKKVEVVEKVVEKPVTQMTVEELKSEIVRITALIAQLQSQLAQLLAIPEIPAGYKFEKTLRYGQKSDDVKYLQIFLKVQGPEIYPEGLTTGYFGTLTKAAVIKFQEKYASEILTPLGLEKGTGFVGEKTRTKINQLLGH